jgi:hypothetical protein
VQFSPPLSPLMRRSCYESYYAMAGVLMLPGKQLLHSTVLKGARLLWLVCAQSATVLDSIGAIASPLLAKRLHPFCFARPNSVLSPLLHSDSSLLSTPACPALAMCFALP